VSVARSYLADKVAMVTGGGRVIGKEIALELAEAGADISLAARSERAMQEVRRTRQKQGVP